MSASVDGADDIAASVAEMSFEKALAELESIVNTLEAGTVELEESITLYQRGDALKRHCQTKLDAARAKIDEIQISADGAVSGAKPFETD